MIKKLLLLVGGFFMAQLTATAGSTPLNLKDVVGGFLRPETMSGMAVVPGTETYTKISPDGLKVEQYDFKTGKKLDILFDVKNTIGEKISDFDGYIMSPNGKKMLIQTETKSIYRRSFKAEYYIYTLDSKKLEPLSTGGPQQVPTWSPDGNMVAFVRNNDIYLVKLLYDNAESRVTTDGKFNEIINGIPDWVNEEEFGHNKALEFTADGTMLCWVKYDERKVKTYSLQMFKGMRPSFNQYSVYPGLYTYKYPKAGEDNSIVTVWSFDIKARVTRQLQVPLATDGYVPRIKASTDATRLIVYTLNRHQDELNLYAVNPRSTIAKLIIQEKADKYVKEDVLSNTIIANNHILLPSDRDGYMRLYLYGMDGQLQRTIGIPKTDVTNVYGFDEENGDVYYQAATINAHDRQIFVAHKSGKIERLSDQEGVNTALFSGNYKYFINTWSDYHTPYVYTLRNNSGKVLETLLDNKKLKKTWSDYAIAKRETFSFTTADGVQLDGWIMKPLNMQAGKRYPVIMFQYSGPGSQQVLNAWSSGSMGNGGLFDAYLAQEGFIVACVDGRGTGGRGSEFEKCTYLNLGKQEAADQVATARYLATLPFVDANRIGIWGWSFGGFCTLMSMSDGSNAFKAGVAIAAPTDWRFYDSIYTERFMRTPKENPTGYTDNPITRAPKLHGALLLCHGEADDNVHPQNVFEYAEALVQADKDFKENIYTNRNHSIFGGNTRNHLLRQMVNFFKKEL